MLKKEWNYFLTALLFFTRIPVPKTYQYQESYSKRSPKYLSLVGWLVGSFTAAILYMSLLLFPPSIAVILSMIASVLLTGAFHEDGFADVCDGFGGGWGKENILRIMKDSTVGAYALIGMSLLLLLKFSLLVELTKVDDHLAVVSLVGAHTTSRFIALSLMYTHPYVRNIENSKVHTVTNQPFLGSDLCYSFLFVVPIFLLARFPIMLFAFLVSFLSRMGLGYYFKKQIGGYTGDCLGAVQQVTEVCFYLSILALS
ncbi:adenosylcobinamide-GDP ribazoletransferase [Aureispira anguillae]|uniref:Adenosylcobinamide-GDP ribazoletransferase n=1 Tax=Aureispira anguillae TaxID=2864201 RepID=A0A915YDQ0_9BACT|nr:adenosylcobinamide-GDP ribazoletransferase [Aureispira anguillae]BDS11188.1 adenosylcobinamide-GDP ribazoletransferase [Aureispira anguillae]